MGPLLPEQPTSQKHTDRSQSQIGTGISSGVKWFLVVQSSLTQWVLLALRQHRTTGHVLPRPSVVSFSTWQAAWLTRGTCWWLTTAILMRAAQTTEQHCFTFSPSAQQGTYLCHGARLQGVMWFRGWGLNSFTELECSESRIVLWV